LNGDGSPVPTRELVAYGKEQGLEIRGQNELNALSALLSRNSDFRNVDRYGWVIVDATQQDEGNA
jgi:hypothetical protein